MREVRQASNTFRNYSVIRDHIKPGSAIRALTPRGQFVLEEASVRLVVLLKKLLPLDDYDFHICGPPPFMVAIYEGLKTLNIPDERIHYEFFGPGTSLQDLPSTDDATKTAGIRHTRFPVTWSLSVTLGFSTVRTLGTIDALTRSFTHNLDFADESNSTHENAAGHMRVNSGTADASPLDKRASDLFGFIPALFDELARSPAVANAYLSALEALKGGVLTDGERNIIMLAVSAANDSTYCVELHRSLARKEDADAQDLNLIAMRQLPNDTRLQALTQTAWQLIDKRGRLNDHDLDHFASYGVERRQINEVIAIIGIKTIANYIQHIRETEIRTRGGNGTTR